MNRFRALLAAASAAFVVTTIVLAQEANPIRSSNGANTSSKK